MYSCFTFCILVAMVASMTRYKNNSRRIGPATFPLPADIQAAIDAVMRGKDLVLFTTMARDPRLFFRFFNSGLLDRGRLTLRQREIVIDRVTAQVAPNTNGECIRRRLPPKPG